MWTATGTVPAGGVQSVVTKQDLTLNLDPKAKQEVSGPRTNPESST